MSLSLFRARLNLRRSVLRPSAIFILCIVIMTRCVSAHAASTLHVAAGSPHARLFAAIYASLPPTLRSARRIEVKEVSKREMERIVAQNESADQRTGDDSLVDGCYQSGTDDETTIATITLRASLPIREMAMVFAHEYGHYVWDEILTDGQQRAYRSLWRTQRRAGNLVTRYASEMDEEGFAEAFAYFVRRPSVLKRRDPRSYAFIAHIVSGQ